MTPAETADELRGLVEDLRHEALHTYSLSLRALLRNAADAIDGMLARLTAAEADADQLAEAFPDIHRDYATGCFGCRAIRLHAEAVALRDPS